MSQQITESEIIEEFHEFFVQNTITIALTALVAYEYIITVQEEVAMFWQRKWTSATLLFALNRYLLIILAVLDVTPFTPQRYACSGAYRFLQILNTAQLLVFAFFSALRVYALWDRNVACFSAVFALNLVPVGTAIYLFANETPIFVPSLLGPVCTVSISLSSGLFFHRKHPIFPDSHKLILSESIVTLVTRSAVIAADALVLVLTWMKTFKNSREARQLGIKSPLASLLLRDGTIYFLALLAMNVAQILIQSIPSLNQLSLITVFIDNLTPVLISRFLLNLREAAEPQDAQNNSFNSRFSVPMFNMPTLASFAGNMGESLGGNLAHAGGNMEVEALGGEVSEEDTNESSMRHSDDIEEVLRHSRHSAVSIQRITSSVSA